MRESLAAGPRQPYLRGPLPPDGIPLATPDLRDHLQTALGTQDTVERELGRGGMATVYLARDLRHERLVALKGSDRISAPRRRECVSNLRPDRGMGRHAAPSGSSSPLSFLWFSSLV
jgi:hypothetical protein